MLNKNELKEIDLFLIDGRFRTAYALKLFEFINEKQILIFDDFKSRYWFHEVKNFYEIIDQTKEGEMVVLKKKNVEKPRD